MNEFTKMLFWELDDGGAGGSGGQDDNYVEDNPVPDFPYADVLLSDEDDVGLSRDDIMSELEKVKQENARLATQANSVQAMTDSFSQLKDVLGKNNHTEDKPTQSQQSTYVSPFAMRAGESADDYKTRTSEMFYNDPVSAAQQIQNLAMGPLVQNALERNLKTSKRFLTLDLQKKEFYNKYQSEVESTVQKMSPQEKLNDDNIYDKAYQQVMANHLDEIVASKVQEHLKTTTQSEGQGTQRRTGSPPGAGYNAPNVNQDGRKVVKLTPSQKSYVENMAMRKGSTKEQVVGWLTRTGKLHQI